MYSESIIVKCCDICSFLRFCKRRWSRDWMTNALPEGLLVTRRVILPNPALSGCCLADHIGWSEGPPRTWTAVYAVYASIDDAVSLDLIASSRSLLGHRIIKIIARSCHAWRRHLTCSCRSALAGWVSNHPSMMK